VWFFGHVKGAFTGALPRLGRFELAAGGTLLLDEVGEIPIDLQAKLLRVLQEQQYERVGDARTRNVDVRVVAMTNRDLLSEIRQGRFRQDLYYRLAVFPIKVPPLRARRDDVPLLARHFVALAARRLGVPRPELDADQIAALMAYDWPGNVRELQNVVERAMITQRGGHLDLDPGALQRPTVVAPATLGDAVLTEAEVRSLERANLERALARCDGRIYGPSGAAELLGIPPTTLANRVRRMNLTIPS